MRRSCLLCVRAGGRKGRTSQSQTGTERYDPLSGAWRFVYDWRIRGADRPLPGAIGRLKAAGIPISDPVIVARTGWSTGDLISALDANPPSPPFRIVTLLIGVNNQYRKLGLSGYETQFKELLNQAIQYAGRERVFVFSIPDYAYTPFGQRTSDPSRISNEIDEYNALNRKITESQGVLYFDITPISRRGLDEPVLVASDGLHPSGEMYRRWVDLALPAITERLKK